MSKQQLRYYATVVGGDMAESSDGESIAAFVADALGGDEGAFTEAQRAVAMARNHALSELTVDRDGATVLLTYGYGAIPQPSPRQQVSHLHRRAARLQDARKKIEKRAGKALRDYDGVLQEQNDAIDFFAAGNFSHNSQPEIAAAGRRIARLSDMLVAADQHRDAVIVERQAKDRLAEARERMESPAIRPVAAGRSR